MATAAEDVDAAAAETADSFEEGAAVEAAERTEQAEEEEAAEADAEGVKATAEATTAEGVEQAFALWRHRQRGAAATMEAAEGRTPGAQDRSARPRFASEKHTQRRTML